MAPKDDPSLGATATKTMNANRITAYSIKVFLSLLGSSNSAFVLEWCYGPLLPASVATEETPVFAYFLRAGSP